MSDSNNKISHVVSNQVPFFVRNDHGEFISFLEHYYKYLEQDGKAVNVSRNILNYRDIDKTTDEIAEHMYSQFMRLMPSDILADRKLILKHVREFYRHCGSQKSARFLMRVLFNEEVEFYYPQKDILKTSDGKWFVQKALRIKDVTIDNVSVSDAVSFSLFANTQIQGSRSGSRAVVERTDRYYDKSNQIDEVILSNLDGEFDFGESVSSTYTDSTGTHTISANVYSGVITVLDIFSKGSLYNVGDPVIISGNTGNGACAYISSVSTKGIESISVVQGGAGYSLSDSVVISGGSGTGAAAEISMISDDGTAHPNSYTISLDTIELEANTPINNAVYSNLSSSNANVSYANALSFYTFSNLGPVAMVDVVSQGTGYDTLPDVTVLSNVQLRSLGIIGTLSIVSGGDGYQIGDSVVFTNPYGSYGFGAAANVTGINVANSNTITSVSFYSMSGLPPGGVGYDKLNPPLISVSSANGANAVIQIDNMLGYGASFTSTNSAVGMIEAVSLVSGGDGYGTDVTADVSGYGDGTGMINVTIVTGVYSYPGRFLNDDGFISAANFLQGRDYYQKYSYVIRSAMSVKEYEMHLADLIHPAGTKFFGELVYTTQTPVGVDDNSTQYSNVTLYSTSYQYSNVSNVVVINNPTSTDNFIGLLVSSNASTLVVDFDSDELSVMSNVYNIANINATTISISANLSGYSINVHTGNVIVGLSQ